MNEDNRRVITKLTALWLLHDLEELTAALQKARDHEKIYRRVSDFWHSEWQKEFKSHNITLKKLDEANEEIRKKNP